MPWGWLMRVLTLLLIFILVVWAKGYLQKSSGEPFRTFFGVTEPKPIPTPEEVPEAIRKAVPPPKEFDSHPND